jgi:hypothetical protein
LRQKSGYPIHNSHPRFIDPNNIPLPTCLLTSNQIDDIVHVVNATSNKGTTHNYLHGTFGKFINLMKADCLCRKYNGDLQSAKDDIDIMMDNLLKSNKISFVSLADVPSKDYFDNQLLMDSSETTTISTTKAFFSQVQCRVIDDKSDISCLSEQIVEERE